MSPELSFWAAGQAPRAQAKPLLLADSCLGAPVGGEEGRPWPDYSPCIGPLGLAIKGLVHCSWNQCSYTTPTFGYPKPMYFSTAYMWLSHIKQLLYAWD